MQKGLLLYDQLMWALNTDKIIYCGYAPLYNQLKWA